LEASIRCMRKHGRMCRLKAYQRRHAQAVLFELDMAVVFHSLQYQHRIGFASFLNEASSLVGRVGLNC
jgi:hypothetical protein